MGHPRIVGMDHEQAGVPRVPESLLNRGRGGRRLPEGSRRYERRQDYPPGAGSEVRRSSQHTKKIVVKTAVGQPGP